MPFSKKVMIIEDDVMLAEFYAAFMKREFDIESDIFNSGESVIRAIDMQGDEAWLFYICDLKIPFKEGGVSNAESLFQGFELIESNLPPCRTLIASGYVSPEIAAEAKRLGVVSIFQKPPNLNALAILINFLLNCVVEASD